MLFALLTIALLQPLVDGVCQDDPTENCASFKDKCRDPGLIPMLEIHCPVTCNLCTPPPACVDARTECPNWARQGFCSSSFYSDDEKARDCAYTCKLCPTNPPPGVSPTPPGCPYGPSEGPYFGGLCAGGSTCLKYENICCPPPDPSDCPYGKTSGPCAEGMCPAGYYCQDNNFCCRVLDSCNGTHYAGKCSNGQCNYNGYTCVDGDCCANHQNQCPNDVQSVGSCDNLNQCPSNYTCYYNVCCPTTSICPSGQTGGPCLNGLCETGYTCDNYLCCKT